MRFQSGLRGIPTRSEQPIEDPERWERLAEASVSCLKTLIGDKQLGQPPPISFAGVMSRDKRKSNAMSVYPLMHRLEDAQNNCSGQFYRLRLADSQALKAKKRKVPSGSSAKLHESGRYSKRAGLFLNQRNALDHLAGD